VNHSNNSNSNDDDDDDAVQFSTFDAIATKHRQLGRFASNTVESPTAVTLDGAYDRVRTSALGREGFVAVDGRLVAAAA